MTNPTIFISYSHKDEYWKDRLRSQLGGPAKQDILSVWHDRQIGPGEEWRAKIQEAMNSASVAVLLVSEHFLNSDFIINEEVPRLLQRRDEEGLIIFPVIIDHCLWEEADWLRGMQVRPNDAKPVADKEGPQRTKALAAIAREIIKTLRDIESANRVGAPSASASSHTAAPEPYPFRPLPVEYVSRQRLYEDEDLVKFLKEKLSPGSGVKFMILSGKPGMGKTASAQQAVKELQPDYQNRIVWVGAQGDEAITLSDVIDNIIRRLLPPREVPAPKPEVREHQARFLLRGKPTLIAIDDFDCMPEDEQKSCIRWFSEEPYSTVLLVTWRALIPEIDDRINVSEVTDEMTDSEAKEFWGKITSRAPINKHVLDKLTAEEVIERYSTRNPFILYRGVLMSVQLFGKWQSPEEVLSDENVAQRVFRRYFKFRMVGEEGSAVLLALSLFTPHASWAALAEVAGIVNERSFAESLSNLVTLRLISPSASAEGRYELDKTYLKYAREYMKEHPLAAELRGRFVQYFVRYLEAHRDADPVDFDAIELEKGNVFGALEIASDVSRDGGRLQSLMKMLDVLGRPNDGFFEYRGYWDVALKYGGLALRLAREQGFDDKGVLARITCLVAGLHSKRGNYEAARELLGPLLDDGRGSSVDAPTRLNALHLMGMIEFAQHNYKPAESLFHRELATIAEAGGGKSDLWGVAGATQELGRIARVRGKFEDARHFYERSLGVRRRLTNPDGSPQLGAAKSSLHDLGLLAQQQGEWEQLHGNHQRAQELYEEAGRRYDEALDLKRKYGNESSVAHTLTEMGELERLRAGRETSTRKKADRYRQARKWLMESLKIKEKYGDEMHIAYTNYILGRIAVDKGEIGEAQRRWQMARAIRDKYSDRAGIAGCNYLEGLIAERRGDKAAAGQLYRQALDTWQEMGLIAAQYARVALARVSDTSS